MKVELKRDTIVRFSKGTVLEVSEEEASRLIAFGNAVAVEKEDVSDKAKMDDSDIAAFTEQAFKMYGGDLVDITVEFNDKLIGVIQDKFGEDTKIVRTGTNKCVAPIQVQVSPTFWGWIFQFGTDMRILSPETLSDEYKKRASDIANM